MDRLRTPSDSASKPPAAALPVTSLPVAFKYAAVKARTPPVFFFNAALHSGTQCTQ